MPGYGIAAADEGSGLLAWSWAVERLVRSHDYWFATVRPDGRPHVMPVWGVFLDDELWLSTGPASRKARNLGHNDAVVVTTDEAVAPVVVEGRARPVVVRPAVERFAAAMDEKYETTSGVAFYAEQATFAVTIDRAFGLDDDDFTGSPTRWTPRRSRT